MKYLTIIFLCLHGMLSAQGPELALFFENKADSSGHAIATTDSIVTYVSDVKYQGTYSMFGGYAGKVRTNTAVNLGDAFTLTGRIRSSTTTRAVVMCNNVGSGNPGMLFYIDGTTNYLLVRTWDASLNEATAQSINNAWVDNEFHFFVLEVDRANSKCRFFIDGVNVTSDSTLQPDFANNQKLCFGAEIDGGGSFYSTTHLDITQLYGRILSSLEKDSLRTRSNTSFMLGQGVEAPATYTPVPGRDYVLSYAGVDYIPSFGGVQYYFTAGAVSPPVNFNYDGVCPTGGTRLTDTDCAYVTFSYAPTRKIKSAADYVNKIYIDPEYSGTEAGTITQPYNAWTDVTQASNTAYLFKQGVGPVYVAGISVPGTLTNILFGSYGSGTMPKIISTSSTNTFMIRAPNCTVRDLDISCPNYTWGESGGTIVGDGTCITLWDGTADNTDIYNNVLHDGFIGVFTYSVDTRIIGNEIYNQYLDGIWNAGFPTDPLNYCEIGDNYIHDVNLAWFDHTSTPTNDALSPGDGIQIEYYYREMWVHDNIVDRSNSSNKQTILFNTSDVNHASMMLKVVLEDNTIVSPKQTGKGVPAVNLHGSGVASTNRYTIARNTFYTLDARPNTGLWSETANDSIYGNVFRDFNYGVHIASGNAFIDNNTFVRNNQAIYGGTASTLRNNIFWLNLANYTGVSTGTVLTNLITDPDFVNTAGNDFHLQAGSDAIDTGTLLPFFKLDRDKIPTWIPDIGAYTKDQ